jgi:ABC-type branched-subunit amino acid transport system substrate-binding protein
VVEQVNSVGGVNGKMLELVIYDDQALATSKAP